MKKKVKRIAVMSLVLSMILLISASAYSQTLDLDYSYDGSRVNFANTYSTNCSVMGFVEAMQVNLYVYEEMSQTVICDTYNVKDNPTSQKITSSWSSRSLPAGRYVDEGAGVIKFIDQLSFQDTSENKTTVFKHDPNKTAQSIDVGNTSDLTAVTEVDLIKRGNEILSSFNSDQSDYTVIVNTDLTEYIEFDDYLNIKRSLNLTFGDTVPVYYLHNNGKLLLAVKQDASGINYRYSFSKDLTGNWELQTAPNMVEGDKIYRQEFINNADEMLSTSVKSEAPDTETEEDIDYVEQVDQDLVRNADEVVSSFAVDPTDYTTIQNTELTDYVSVEEYLSIKKNLNLTFGDSVPVYYLSDDEMSLIAVKQDASGSNYVYLFSKNAAGEWELNFEQQI